MNDWLRLQARLPLLDEHQIQRLERELGETTLSRLWKLFVEDGREQGGLWSRPLRPGITTPWPAAAIA